MFALVLVQGGLPSLLVVFRLAQIMDLTIGQWEDGYPLGRHPMILDSVEGSGWQWPVRECREASPRGNSHSIRSAMFHLHGAKTNRRSEELT